MAFDEAAAGELYSGLKSPVEQLGVFSRVDAHEPVNAPGNGLSCSIVLDSLKPVTLSGLNSTSGQVTFLLTIWSPASQRPLEGVDPKILAACAALISAYSAGFTLGGLVRDVDLFAMSADAGWTEADGKQFRAMRITVPVVINDMFSQEA